ncbi:hypothetical protein QT918_019415, partial [Xanthomonas campestris pv. campestris]|uniref:hypothetical protein n=1 Tax=Xanthomonas campestris TaxID=339 RepID=UPI0035902D8C
MGAMGLIGNAHRARGRSYGKIVWFCGVATRSRLSLRSCGVFVNQMTVQTLDNVPTPKKRRSALGRDWVY